MLATFFAYQVVPITLSKSMQLLNKKMYKAHAKYHTLHKTTTLNTK